VNSDGLSETDETFVVNLSGPTNAVLGDSRGVATIREPRPFHTLTPCRVFDTRDPAGPRGGPALPAGGQRSFVVTGVCAVPASARAVSVNLTIVIPAAAGHLTVFAADSPVPLASTLNFSAGQVRANNAVFPLPVDGTGRLRFANGAPGAVHVILDVNGYFE